jgi:multidrug resistance efflux pump
MISLYEVSGAIKQLAEMLSEGEIDQQTYNDTISSLGAENAIEDVIKAIRNYQSEAEALKAEADKLTAKRKTAEATADRLKAMVMGYMKSTEQSSVTAGVFKVSRGSTKAVNIYDEKALPGIYLVEQPPKPDKAAMLQALKLGEEIPGAELTTNEHIKIK